MFQRTSKEPPAEGHMVESIQDLRNPAIDSIRQPLRVGQQAARSEFLEAIARAIITVVKVSNGRLNNSSHDAGVELRLEQRKTKAKIN